MVNAEQRLQQAAHDVAQAGGAHSLSGDRVVQAVCEALDDDPASLPLCDASPLDSADGMADDTPAVPLETLVCPTDPGECDDADLPPCWGGQLLGTAKYCSPGLEPSGGRFKNKFCPSCLGGIQVSANRVWMLTPPLRKVLKNGKSHGFWSVGPTQFRVINNTINAGPALVIFRSPPIPVGDAPSGTWVPWVQDGWVRLLVSRGTLVPARPSRELAIMQPMAGLHGDANEEETWLWDDVAPWIGDPTAPRKRR